MRDGQRETRTVIAECRHKGKTIRVEQVQQWRAGFELTYEGFVDDKKTQENMKPVDVVGWLMNMLMDGS